MTTATKTKEPQGTNPGLEPPTDENKKATDVIVVDGDGVIVEVDEYAEYAADAGGGFENVDNSDMAVPFLTVLQPGSPEVQGEEAPAKSGMYKNGATGEFISGKTGFTFIPAFVEHLLVEWLKKNPDGSGGGYVGPHAIDSELAVQVRRDQPLGKYSHPVNGNDLIETYYVTGVALTPDGSPFPAIIPFSSTFIKVFKGWIFRARAIVIKLPDGRKVTQVPLWAHSWNITTELQQKGGHSWYIPSVRFAGTDAEDSRLPPSSDLYKLAKGVKEAMSAGELKADTRTLSRDPADTERVAPAGDRGAQAAPY